MSKTSLIIVFAMCFLGSKVFAETLERGEIKLTQHEKAHASRWNLSPKEYQRYKQILKSPRAYFTPNLDKNPILALALESRTKEERQHYADLWVKIQYENNLKSLVWVLSVDEAWKRNYPGVPRFTYGQPQAEHHAASQKNQPTFKAATLDDVLKNSKPNRKKIFVKTTDCSTCVTKLRELKNALKVGAISGIDVFFVDNPDKATVARWGANQGITLQEVNEKRIITLNRTSTHDGLVPYVEDVADY